MKLKSILCGVLVLGSFSCKSRQYNSKTVAIKDSEEDANSVMWYRVHTDAFFDAKKLKALCFYETTRKSNTFDYSEINFKTYRASVFPISLEDIEGKLKKEFAVLSDQAAKKVGATVADKVEEFLWFKGLKDLGKSITYEEINGQILVKQTKEFEDAAKETTARIKSKAQNRNTVGDAIDDSYTFSAAPIEYKSFKFAVKEVGNKKPDWQERADWKGLNKQAECELTTQENEKVLKHLIRK